MRYACEDCDCHVIVSIDDDLPEEERDVLYDQLESDALKFDVSPGACEAHHLAEECETKDLQEARTLLRDWLHDTYGPLAWPKDHPVARALALLEE